MENKKKILIVCLVIVIIASIITNIYILSNKPEENTFKIDGIDTLDNQDILKDATIEGLKITNISLITREGISTYKATITNTTDKEIDINQLYVTFYEDKKENKILALMNTNLEPNASTNISITSESDLSGTTNIKYAIEDNVSE